MLDDARHRGDRARLGRTLAHEHRQHQLAGVDRGLGDQPPQAAGRAQAPRPGHRPRHRGADVVGHCVRTFLRLVGLRSDGLVTGWPASSIAARRAAPKSASASTSSSTSGFGARTSTRRPCSSRGLGRGRADHRDDRRRVRLAGDADQVAHRRGRGEDDRVELAGLDRVAHRRRRRGRPDGAVGRDVVDSQPRSTRPATRFSVAMSARGRKTRLIGSSTSSYCGQSASSPAADCSPLGHQVGAQPPVADRRGGLVADGGDLEAGEGAGVEAVLLELLADGLDRVDRGEGDPLVAALDQAADGLVHLQRVARRLDRDGRDLLGYARRSSRSRADSEPACSLVRGTRTRQPNSGLVSNHDSASRMVDHVADHGDRRRGHPGGAGVGRDVLEGRGDRLLLGRGAGAGHRDRGVGRATGVDQGTGDLADRADGRQQHQRADVRRSGSSRPSRRR